MQNGMKKDDSGGQKMIKIMKYEPKKKIKVYSEEQIIKIKNLFPSKTI